MDDDAAELQEFREGTVSATSAITLLTEDLDELRQVFQDYAALMDAGARPGERRAVVDRLCLLLSVHTGIEEEIFYPAARDALDDPGLINEALADHEAMQALIAELQEMQAGDAAFDAGVQALQTVVERHADEEETELFPSTGDSAMDLEALGEQMRVRKSELTVELGGDAARLEAGPAAR